MKIRMEALKPHRYGKARSSGEFYQAASKDVRLIKALGWAKESPELVSVPSEPQPVIKTAPIYQRRDLVGEQKPAPDHADKPRTRRVYRRRDQTSE